MIVAMLIFMFVFGYNQYLWPLLVTSSEQYWTVVMGLKMMSGSIVHRFAFVMMSMVPPILIIIEAADKIVSGNTNEYHPINSPNAKSLRPIPTKRVVFFLP